VKETKMSEHSGETVEPARPVPTLFEWMGGMPAIERAGQHRPSSVANGKRRIGAVGRSQQIAPDRDT